MTSLFNSCRPKVLLRPTSSQAGGSVLEVALLCPVMTLILFGMIDLGRWVFLTIEVASSARAGAQYGGQNRGTALDTSGIQTAAQNDVPDIPSLTVTSSTSSCWCSSSPGTNVSCNLSSCTGGSQLIPLLQVNTSTSYNPWILYGVFTTAVTITGQVVVPQGQ
jgi:TadE-like protein